MTGFQQNAVDRLALEHGRVAIRDGFEDEGVRVTVPSGVLFLVGLDGVPRPSGVNFSVDWSE